MRLDALRGVAALVVVLHHVRKLLLVPREDVSFPLSIGVHFFYWISSFSNGHNAVLIFFVLSGFLVGGSVFRSLEGNRWTIKAYAADRLTRLYIVLVPTLVLTAVVDRLIAGTTRGLQLMTDSNVAFQSGSTLTFLGNLAFLQKLYCAPFGVDFSLWSLSYEFWYYLAFPFLVLGIFRARTLIQRFALGLGLLAVCLGMRQAAWLFPVWLLGASLHYLKEHQLVSQGWCRPLVWLTVSAMVGESAVQAKLYRISPLLPEWIFGILSFVLLYLLLLMKPRRPISRAYAGVARYFSTRSYTLYMVHAPLLVLFVSFAGHRYSQPTTRQIGLCLEVFLGTLMCAEGIYRLFEARTNRLRKWVYQLVGITPSLPLNGSPQGAVAALTPEIERGRALP